GAWVSIAEFNVTYRLLVAVHPPVIAGAFDEVSVAGRVEGALIIGKAECRFINTHLISAGWTGDEVLVIQKSGTASTVVFGKGTSPVGISNIGIAELGQFDVCLGGGDVSEEKCCCS